MDKKNLARWLTIPIALLLVIVLLMQISLSDIVKAFASISPQYLLISFILYISIYIARAARFRTMLKNSMGYGTIFNIVCLHTLANSVMPFKTGELAFVYLSRVRLNISAGIGLATVTIARMFDALAVCMLFILALAMAQGDVGLLSEAEPIVLALAALLVLMTVSVMWFSPLFLRLIKSLFRVRALSGLRLSYIQSKLEEIAAFYSSPESRGSVLRLFLLSVTIWTLCALSMVALTMSMGLGVGLWAIVMGALITVMFSALPIHGIGSLGTTELAWSAAFMALGTPKEAAISSGFAVHIVILVFTAILGVYALASDRYFHASDKKGLKS